MGPTWGRQDPGRPHVGPINLTIRVCIFFDHGLAAHCFGETNNEENYGSVISLQYRLSPNIFWWTFHNLPAKQTLNTRNYNPWRCLKMNYMIWKNSDNAFILSAPLHSLIHWASMYSISCPSIPTIHKYRIKYVLEWRTVYALPAALLQSLFP